jgi:dTDP-glucose pyrophosphorylase
LKDFRSNIISQNVGILEAMSVLNSLPETLTLFIVDENNRLVGTLTDGDIRRGFIRGLNLNAQTREFMTTKFRAISYKHSVYDFKNIRDSGVRLLPVLDDRGIIVKVHDLKRRKSKLPLEAVIMAGGRGERLRPLTDAIPKPMLLIGGKPIIEHNIDRLIRFGVEKIYISVRYLGEQITDYFGDGSLKGISIEYLFEDQPLGTAGALSLLENINTEYFLLMNSDLFTDVDFEDLFLNVIQKEADLGIATVTHTVKIPYGIIKENGQYVKSLKEKPVFTNYANAGIYVLRKELVQEIPKNTRYDITDLIDSLLDKNCPIIQNPIIGFWIDIGQHQDYLNAKEIAMHMSNND